MLRSGIVSLVVVALPMCVARVGLADVPAPPANQEIGMLDAAPSDLTEATCRVCHNSGVPDRHHLLYGEPIPADSLVPYPDGDGDGQTDLNYGCLNCHGQHFTVERDCTVCHNGASPHHETAAADAGHCSACHGDLVNDADDGHYIPVYAPSLVTPTRSQGDGLPLNGRDNGAGACNYCHDADGLTPPFILSNHDLHHGINLSDFANRCDWCHDFTLPFDQQIRICEDCHGPESLHNIQADSPNPDNVGTIVVGGETAGYGHVGRDAGPGDSDCWGCHGFGMGTVAAVAPGSGPITPMVYDADVTAIVAGTDTLISLTGSSFTNFADGMEYRSHVAITAAGSTPVILTPEAINQQTLDVLIPGDIPAGNYHLEVVKADRASNPVAITIRPEVVISGASGDGVVTITGSGFGGYAAGSGTTVTGTVTTGRGRSRTTTTVEAVVLSWSDTTIQAEFGLRPSDVTVNSVFGSAVSDVRRAKKGNAHGHIR